MKFSVLNKTLLKNTGVYTLGNILNAIIPFALMPVMTRYLSPVDYGITTMLAMLIGIVMPFTNLNMAGAITVDYFKKKYNIRNLISASFFLLIIFSMIAYFAFVLSGSYITSWTAFPFEYLWSVVLLCATNYVTLLLQSLYRVRNEPIKCISVQILQTLSNITLSLYMVVELGMNWQGRVDAQIVTGVIWCFLSCLLIARMGYIGGKIKYESIKHLLSFGLPLVPHALSVYFIIAADRVFITKFCGIADVGVFSVGYQFGMAIEMITSAFNNAFSPWLYNKLANIKEDTKLHLVKLTYTYIILLLLFAILYSIFMPDFLSFFVGAKFHSAYIYVGGFAIAAVFKGMYYMVVNYIFFVGKTGKLAVITCSSGVLHVIITYFLISNIGALGAAYAAMITNLVMLICTWYWSAHVYDMPWFSSRIIRGAK